MLDTQLVKAIGSRFEATILDETNEENFYKVIYKKEEGELYFHFFHDADDREIEIGYTIQNWNIFSEERKEYFDSFLPVICKELQKALEQSQAFRLKFLTGQVKWQMP